MKSLLMITLCALVCLSASANPSQEIEISNHVKLVKRSFKIDAGDCVDNSTFKTISSMHRASCFKKYFDEKSGELTKTETNFEYTVKHLTKRYRVLILAKTTGIKYIIHEIDTRPKRNGFTISLDSFVAIMQTTIDEKLPVDPKAEIYLYTY